MANLNSIAKSYSQRKNYRFPQGPYSQNNHTQNYKQFKHLMVHIS